MVNYGLLAEAQKYYQEKGYNYIEVPWMVSARCDEVTKPADCQEMKIEYNGKHLIASGEQGFLYLRMKGYIPDNAKLQTITPCFRNEPQDNTHQKMFMKCELVQFMDRSTDMEALAKVMESVRGDAFEFFKAHVKEPDELLWVNCTSLANRSCRTYWSYDIIYNGFELGSYGIREYNDITWIYGTGLAEPRFSKVNSIYLRDNV